MRIFDEMKYKYKQNGCQSSRVVFDHLWDGNFWLWSNFPKELFQNISVSFLYW